MEDLFLLPTLITLCTLSALYAEVPSLRVMNGTEAKLGQFPFAVAIVLNYGTRMPVCSGSLITPENVLTAAHCFNKSIILKERAVLAGDVDPLRFSSAKPPSSKQLRNITSVITHPRAFDKRGHSFIGFDIAILAVDGTQGYTESNRKLHYGEFTVNARKCDPILIKMTAYCVYSHQRIIHLGDSGGPLIGGYAQQNYQYGSLSVSWTWFGNKAGIYTDLTFYRSWIMNNVNIDYRLKESVGTWRVQLHRFQLLEETTFGFLVQKVLTGLLAQH